VRVEKIATELLVERLADWGVDTVFGLLKRSARHQVHGIPKAIRSDVR
jgi:thiamine pyrophosphate-dependent acetolactate synthase large subunit-like protein